MNTKSNFTWISIVLIFGLAVSFLGVSVVGAEESIKIGAILPLTGTSEVEGQDMNRGLKIALEEINASGGVMGRELEAIVEDTETRPKAGLDAVHKLVDVNDVPIILGAYFSSVSLPTGKYSNDQGVVQISWSTSPALRDIGEYFFGVTGTDELMAKNTVEYAADDADTKKFGIIVDNSAYGLGVLENSKKAIEDMGGEIVSVVKYEREKADYRPELERLFSNEPDVVVGTLIGKDARKIFKQAHELGFKPAKGWYLSWVSLATAPAIPETVEGVKGLIGRFKGPQANRFNAKYEKRYGEEPPTVWGHYAYDAAWLSALAMNFANSTDPDEIKDSLMNIAPVYRGVSGGGNKSFDEDGMQKFASYQRMVVKDGELEIL